MRRLALLAVAGLATLAAPSAHAALRVYSPIVEEGEAEVETQFDATGDHRPTRTGNWTANVSLGYGVTEHWHAEIEGQWKRDPQGKPFFDSTSFENIIQVTPQGKYWVDVGFFAEYETVTQAGDHNNVTFGPLFQSEFGDNLTTLNLLFTHDLGNRSAPGLQFDLRLQSVWRINQYFAPGAELYWQPGRLGAFPGLDAQGLRSGPVITGGVSLHRLGNLKYEIGYLFGVTGGAPQSTLRGVLEYEFQF